MTARKCPPIGRPRKWKDADWDAAIKFFETTLHGSLKSLSPPDLPNYIVVWKRGRTDRRVRELLAAATERRCAAMVAAGLRTGEGKRASGTKSVTFATVEKFGRGLRYSDEAYSEYLARLEADETAESLGEAQKLYWPGLPTFHSVMRRRRQQLQSILSGKGFVGRGGRPRIFEEEVYAEAIRFLSTMSLTEYADHRQAVGALPSAQAILRRAARDPEFARELYSKRPKTEGLSYRYSNEVYEAAISKIGAHGWSAYLEECKPGVWPSLNAIYKRARGDKEFKARLNGKTRERFRLKRELRALTARRQKVALARPDGQLGFLLLQQDAYRMADKFVPRHYAREDRDDIKSDIVAAVLARELEIDEIGDNASWFISEHFRGGVFSSGKFSSLDAPVYDDSSLTYVDRLSSDDYSHIG
ncbi:hypothetical protein E4K64_25500 [Bradyrhizobium frederickii]|uniref:Uncharacterized protein n=1 Tax=Bradyrhizobium frederickii TaxID=2560054 RepID=A0A4Y9NXX1_9BRAD|nr:hypothetical protein [Bradyrhizobium frederickii]TFV71686.1 hypothetical protein E4K64_25500 [Bradyrhizobium frederickii]